MGWSIGVGTPHNIARKSLAAGGSVCAGSRADRKKFCQIIMPLRGSVLQAETCQISSLAENPRWSRVWQYCYGSILQSESCQIFSFIWKSKMEVKVFNQYTNLNMDSNTDTSMNFHTETCVEFHTNDSRPNAALPRGWRGGNFFRNWFIYFNLVLYLISVWIIWLIKTNIYISEEYGFDCQIKQEIFKKYVESAFST